MLKKMRWN